MPKIEWESSFCVDVPEIDEQHKKWIAIINDLHELLLHGSDFSESIQGKFLEMRDYGRAHFTYEEQYMESIGYPLLKAHKEEHCRFLSEIEGYLQTRELLLHSDVMQILMSWLKHHILSSDKKYMQYSQTGARGKRP